MRRLNKRMVRIIVCVVMVIAIYFAFGLDVLTSNVIKMVTGHVEVRTIWELTDILMDGVQPIWTRIGG